MSAVTRGAPRLALAHFARQEKEDVVAITVEPIGALENPVG